MQELAKLMEKDMRRAAITERMQKIFMEAQQKREMIDSSNQAEAEERAAKDDILRIQQREDLWNAIDKYLPLCYTITQCKNTQ